MLQSGRKTAVDVHRGDQNRLLILISPPEQFVLARCFRGRHSVRVAALFRRVPFDLVAGVVKLNNADSVELHDSAQFACKCAKELPRVAIGADGLRNAEERRVRAAFGRSSCVSVDPSTSITSASDERGRADTNTLLRCARTVRGSRFSLCRSVICRPTRRARRSSRSRSKVTILPVRCVSLRILPARRMLRYTENDADRRRC